MDYWTGFVGPGSPTCDNSFAEIAARALLVVGATPAAFGGELRIVTHILPPFTLEGTAVPVGFAVDIVNAVMQRTGDRGIVEIEPFPRLLRDVISGPNTLGFIIARTPEREHLMRWVGPIIVTRVFLYTKAGSKQQITSLEQARSLAAIAVGRANPRAGALGDRGFADRPGQPPQDRGVIAYEMKQLERSRGNLSIVIMDIDHFKLVNDTHGHQAGDRVLVTVSRILARSIRSADTAGRWGGEEILVVCPHTGLDGAMLAAERLRPAT